MNSYKGYKEVSLTAEEHAALYEFPHENTCDCLTNEYLIVKDSNGEVVNKLKWNGFEYRPLSYRSIKSDYVGNVKPRNLQ